MSRGIEDSARVDELKLEEFLDFVARMIARRWIQEHRDQGQKSPADPEHNTGTNSELPESGPDTQVASTGHS
jgi:hypothetical protein